MEQAVDAAAAAVAAATEPALAAEPTAAALEVVQEAGNTAAAAAAAAAAGAEAPASVLAAEADAAADAAGGGPAAVYVSYEEKKEPSERKPPRKSSGHTYTVKFYLVDSHGTEYLAAVGEDQGDAHYLYENQSSFPFLRANNKADVRSWLEGIIERSKERAGVHTHLVMDDVPQDPNQIHLPKFVGHTHVKTELPDGRHRIEWHLVDADDGAHLAIVGEEKETRDGHYLYRTQGIFDKARPLQVGNQREVERWIDIMVYHGGVAPTHASGKAPGGADSSGRAHSALLSDVSGHRSRAGGSARPSGQKAGQKHDLLKQATSNVKKLKTQGGRLGADPDAEARETVSVELHKWAQEEAQRREAAKKQALAYVTDPLVGKEAAAAKRCLATLKQAVAQAAFLPPADSSGSHQQQQNLVDVLAALRELGHMYAPLSLIAMPELKDCLGGLQSNQHPEVKLLATSVLEQWLHTAVAQAQVLSDPRYVQDPRSVLETKLASREVMDPIVAAVTHRKLHPPPAAAAGGQQRQQQQHGQPQERAGSRLGPAAGLAAAAGGGGGGGAGGEESQGAATPGGLSARPSEQSLPGLAAAAGTIGIPSDAQEAPAASTGTARPAGTDGGGGGEDPPSAAAAAALAAQTVERRRLNMDAIDSPAVITAAGRRRQADPQQTMSSSGGGEEEGGEVEMMLAADADVAPGGTGAAVASGAAAGGHAGTDEDLEPSSMLLSSDSQQAGGPARRRAPPSGSGGLAYAASVDLINAPIDEMECEQAELLNAGPGFDRS